MTDTHGPYQVGEIRVLRVGGIVALHLGTPAGRFVFHVRERSFVKHARGRTDDQANPFRSLEEIDREVAGDAAAHPMRIRARRGHGATITDDEKKLYGQVIAAHEATGRTFKELCAEANVSYWRFMNWKNPQAAHRRGGDTDGDRPLVLKPGGKLL